jgi:hypothetical protein
VGVARPGRKPFERDELLDSLRALLRNAAAGQGSLLFLEGEAGIGSRITARASQLGRRSGGSLVRLLARHAGRQIITRRVAAFAL